MASQPEETLCPVCSESIPIGRDECPNCGAVVKLPEVPGEPISSTQDHSLNTKEPKSQQQVAEIGIKEGLHSEDQKGLEPKNLPSSLGIFQQHLIDAEELECQKNLELAIQSYRKAVEFAHKNRMDVPVLGIFEPVLERLIARSELLNSSGPLQTENRSKPVTEIHAEKVQDHNLEEVAITETFTNNNNGWPIFNSRTSVGDVACSKIENNRLLLEISAIKNVVHFMIPEAISPVSDFEVSVDLKKVTCQGSSYYGIIFRNNRSQGMQNFYFLSISDDHQLLRFSLRNGGTWKTLMEKSHCGDAFSKDVNKIAVSAQGDLFRFHINQVEMGSVINGSILSGKVGIAVGMFNAGDRISLEVGNFHLHGKRIEP